MPSTLKRTIIALHVECLFHVQSVCPSPTTTAIQKPITQGFGSFVCHMTREHVPWKGDCF